MNHPLLWVFVYATGFGATLFVERWISGPATWGLSLLRAVLWPVYLATGIPRGSRYPIDQD